MYDPELPAGFQDADFEMRELEAQADRIHAAKQRGICVHGWWQTRDDGTVICLEDGCGQVFIDEQAHDDCRYAALGSI
jgi:hypothetical protein